MRILNPSPSRTASSVWSWHRRESLFSSENGGFLDLEKVVIWLSVFKNGKRWFWNIFTTRPGAYLDENVRTKKQQSRTNGE
jgi:hypothetical protein